MKLHISNVTICFLKLTFFFLLLFSLKHEYTFVCENTVLGRLLESKRMRCFSWQREAKPQDWFAWRPIQYLLEVKGQTDRHWLLLHY